jgi:GntR family transcriptional regulator / MocR family aminotransferase
VAAVEVFIDPGDRRGLAEQVYVQVRDAIVEGRLVAGDVLTPSRTLAAQLGMSRFTVAEAYARLAAEGYVDGRRRGGTVVTSAVAAMPQGRARTAIEPTPLAASITPYGHHPTAAPGVAAHRQRSQLGSHRR